MRNLIAQKGGESSVNFMQFKTSIWSSDNAGSGGGLGEIFSDLIDISKFSTPGGFISALYPFLLSGAGLILFIMLTWGGFEVMMGATSPDSVKKGQKRITTALGGFFLLFVSYWIAQIFQVIFGINIGVGQ